MTEQLYSSSAVCARVSNQFDEPEAEEIIRYVDEYASYGGAETVKGMVLFGAGPGRDKSRRRFKRDAARYVRRQKYGSGIFIAIAWFFLRPLVMRIIEAFIESLLFGADDE